MAHPLNAMRVVLFSLLAAGISPSLLAQFTCDDPAAGQPQQVRGAVRGGLSFGGDPFLCGEILTPTPGTCTLYNRFYTDQESSCINQEQAPVPPDYLPIVYGPSLQNYESDTFVVGNWAGDLGAVAPIPKNWYLLWDHIVSPGSPGYIGYYAAQSDLVANGEFGNPRADPCIDSITPPSCMVIVKNTLADDCPQQETPLGTIGNLGPLAPVPVPGLRSLLVDSNTGFSDPAGKIALDWIPACAWTQNQDTIFMNGFAPVPVMGYRVEVFADRILNGVLESPSSAGWDPVNRAVNGGCESGLFSPILDIAPFAGNIAGSQTSNALVFDLAQLTGPGGVLENPSLIEALTFRLRILFRDDRLADSIGGKDLVINPICSSPSAMGHPIANPGIFGAPAGAVPDGNIIQGIPLLVDLETNGDITLTWGNSCNAGDSDFVVFEGELGNPNSHQARFCTTGGGNSLTFTPNFTNSYFLVAPRNAEVVGSLGQGSDGTERFEGLTPCVPQAFGCGGSGQVLPPAVITDPATFVTANSVRLNATVNPEDFQTIFFFEWGTAPSLGNATAIQIAGDGTDNVVLFSDLVSLSPATTYFFRAVADNGIGSSLGNTLSFITGSGLTPNTITDPATNIDIDAATLNGTVNPNGLETTTFFEWGTTPALGNFTSPFGIGSGGTALPVLENLTGLVPSETYFYRLVASNSSGTGMGTTVSFMTDGVMTDLISNGGFDVTTTVLPWIFEGNFFQTHDAAHSLSRSAGGGVSSANDVIGVDNAVGRIYQDVTIPANATIAQFSFWQNITSSDSTVVANDFLVVEVRDLSDSILTTLTILDNTDQTTLGDFSQMVFDLVSFSGQTIRVNFSVTSDSKKPTIFRIDTVTLITDGF